MTMPMVGTEMAERVMIVEDNECLAQSWERAFAENGYQTTCAGTLEDAHVVFDSWSQSACRYLLLDLVLPDGDGTSLLPLVRALVPTPAVAIVTCHLDFERALQLYREGVLVAPKPTSTAAILRIMEALGKAHRPEPSNDPVEAFAERYRLSGREAELLRHTVAGSDVAESLGCGPATVKTYWHRIFTKTGARSQREVISAMLRLHTRAP